MYKIRCSLRDSLKFTILLNVEELHAKVPTLSHAALIHCVLFHNIFLVITIEMFYYLTPCWLHNLWEIFGWPRLKSWNNLVETFSKFKSNYKLINSQKSFSSFPFFYHFPLPSVPLPGQKSSYLDSIIYIHMYFCTIFFHCHNPVSFAVIVNSLKYNKSTIKWQNPYCLNIVIRSTQDDKVVWTHLNC